jgi:methionine biosynthesis protein MetW
VDAVCGRIDESLPYAADAFDYAICNVTIQMVMYPEILLAEMKRIARFQIVSFPNYAFYRSRLDVLFHGRVPKPSLFDYKWYSTGHIHPLSLKDFHELLADVGGLRIVELRLEKSPIWIKDYLMQKLPNLFQVLPVYLLTKES